MNFRIIGCSIEASSYDVMSGINRLLPCYKLDPTACLNVNFCDNVTHEYRLNPTASFNYPLVIMVQQYFKCPFDGNNRAVLHVSTNSHKICMSVFTGFRYFLLTYLSKVCRIHFRGGASKGWILSARI